MEEGRKKQKWVYNTLLEPQIGKGMRQDETCMSMRRSLYRLPLVSHSVLRLFGWIVYWSLPKSPGPSATPPTKISLATALLPAQAHPHNSLKARLPPHPNQYQRPPAPAYHPHPHTHPHAYLPHLQQQQFAPQYGGYPGRPGPAALSLRLPYQPGVPAPALDRPTDAQGLTPAQSGPLALSLAIGGGEGLGLNFEFESSTAGVTRNGNSNEAREEDDEESKLPWARSEARSTGALQAVYATSGTWTSVFSARRGARSGRSRVRTALLRLSLTCRAGQRAGVRSTSTLSPPSEDACPLVYSEGVLAFVLSGTQDVDVHLCFLCSVRREARGIVCLVYDVYDAAWCSESAHLCQTSTLSSLHNECVRDAFVPSPSMRATSSHAARIPSALASCFMHPFTPSRAANLLYQTIGRTCSGGTMPVAVLSISPSPLEHCPIDVADLVLSHRAQFNTTAGGVFSYHLRTCAVYLAGFLREGMDLCRDGMGGGWDVSTEDGVVPISGPQFSQSTPPQSASPTPVTHTGMRLASPSRRNLRKHCRNAVTPLLGPLLCMSKGGLRGSIRSADGSHLLVMFPNG
ncbi:hypothetical protein B0H13DRAFT_2525737 [Mycena leptocephala]|nr:hypothetical protein B0H13DRAFT_2525737 [Mycena leptocephala]